MKNLRIAWLLPVAWYYWQPALVEFTKYFPNTKIFTVRDCSLPIRHWSVSEHQNNYTTHKAGVDKKYMITHCLPYRLNKMACLTLNVCFGYA